MTCPVLNIEFASPRRNHCFHYAASVQSYTFATERPLRVKPGNTRAEQMFSVVHPIADIQQRTRLVRFVPNSEVTASFDHFIGAKQKRLRDIEAMINLNANGACTGRSFGAVPLRILSASAACRKTMLSRPCCCGARPQSSRSSKALAC